MMLLYLTSNSNIAFSTLSKMNVFVRIKIAKIPSFLARDFDLKGWFNAI